MHYLEWEILKNPTHIWIPGIYSNAYELYEIIEQLVQMNLRYSKCRLLWTWLYFDSQKDVSIYDVADDIKVFLLDKLKIKRQLLVVGKEEEV